MDGIMGLMPTQVTGEFDVKLTPLSLHEAGASPMLARMSLDKRFLGPLDAASKGEMLSAGTGVKGSAGYVAIERVEGKLDGRSGTFVLQHSATMNRGEPQLAIVVVPDSGTGELEGLAGRMGIRIESGKHFYDFEYTLESRRYFH